MGHIQDLRPNDITISLGGKVRVIKYDLNAYAELEKRYGSVEVAMNTLQTGSLIGLRAILWAGLIHSEAILDEVTGEPTGYNITPHMVGSWIEPSEMQNVSIKLSEAIVATLPAADKKKAIKELEKLNTENVSEKNV
jgi:hypothetical protein